MAGDGDDRRIYRSGSGLHRFDASYNGINYAFNSSGALIGTPAQFIQPLDKPTWRSALVYKPKPNGSIYFAYGTSFNPSAEALSLTAATAATPPEENESFEGGGKWDLNGGRLTLRGALFRTVKQNAREPDPNDSSIDVLAGNQRVDGAEGAVQGHITDRWELLSSYTFMHSEVVNSNAYPFAVGHPLNNVPQNLFNLWTEYRLPHGLEIGGGSAPPTPLRSRRPRSSRVLPATSPSTLWPNLKSTITSPCRPTSIISRTGFTSTSFIPDTQFPAPESRLFLV